MDMALWFQYLLAVSLLIATPGTAVTLVIQNSKMPWPSVWAIIIGGNVSSGLLLCCAIWGVDWLSTNINLSIVQIWGGIYLLYVGISQLFSTNAIQINANSQKAEVWSFFLHAFTVGISNPKDILFFMSFLSYFLRGGHSFKQTGLLLATWLLIDLAVMWGYAYLFRIQNMIPHQWLHRVGSLCMIFIGLLLLASHII